MPTLLEARASGRSAFRTQRFIAAGWQAWVQRVAPGFCTSPFGARHVRLWDWFDSLTPGEKPPARVEVWPRGGAKSTTGELGTSYVGDKGSRKFVLYVSETQEQADKHVQAISTVLGDAGIGAAVNKEGHSKGWRRNQLRAENGFNVEAIGLDTAARGIKLDQFRPDLIVFDDIDGLDDGAKATQKKIDAITNTIIPAGSGDCAVLFLQNLILENGIVAQLVDGRAKFLARRDVPPIEPAARGLEFEPYVDEGGYNRYRILKGEPTWEGQNLAKIASQLEDWGPTAFLREAQHEVRGAGGWVIDPERIVTGPVPAPVMQSVVVMDLAATEGGGDWSVFGHMLGLVDRRTWVNRIQRLQQEPFGVRTALVAFVLHAYREYPKTIVGVLQDPGGAGKFQAAQLIDDLTRAGFPVAQIRIIRPTGSKAVRVRGAAEDINACRWGMVEATWNQPYRAVLGAFREDDSHLIDDDVDVTSDADYLLWREPGKAPDPPKARPNLLLPRTNDRPSHHA